MKRSISMLSNLAVLALPAALLGGCALQLDPDPTSAASSPIINGEPATAGAYPSIMAVMTNKGSLCTGTLISPTVILTAGHCADPQFLAQPGQPAPTDVTYFASFALDVHGLPESERIAIASVEWHEAFPNIDITTAFERGPKQFNDIALMHLAQPITDHPFQAIALDDEAALLTVGDAYRVAGYGLTSNSDSMAAGILTHGESNLDEIGDWEIAVGDQDPQQACHGDSGGPVMAENGLIQVGIASRINIALLPPPSTPPPCEPGLLYTRIDAYADWIRERVSDLGEQPTGGEPDAGVPPGGADAGDGNGGGEEGEESGGCGCRAAGGSDAGGLLLLIGAVGLVALRPRRRRA
jgi:MYXO-CTERM domain-containing protein